MHLAFSAVPHKSLVCVVGQFDVAECAWMTVQTEKTLKDEDDIVQCIKHDSKRGTIMKENFLT